MQTADKLSTFFNSPSGIIHKKVTTIMIHVRKFSVATMLNIFETICGPRSPITTKYAIQVPIRYPMMQSSTNNFPGGPKAYSAVRKSGLVEMLFIVKLLRYQEIQNFSFGWEAMILINSGMILWLPGCSALIGQSREWCRTENET